MKYSIIPISGTFDLKNLLITRISSRFPRHSNSVILLSISELPDFKHLLDKVFVIFRVIKVEVGDGMRR